MNQSPRSAVRERAAVSADKHDLIVRDGGVSGVGKLGPGVIGENQAFADGE